jgi:hypothetical protein
VKEISRVVISDTTTATAVPRISITPQLMLPRDTTPKRLSAISRPLITTPLRHRITTLQHTLPQLITPRIPNTTPPRHRSATPPHIMGKYSVTWSSIMPTTTYTNYLLPSRMKGEKRWKNSAAEWASPLQQQELPCTSCHQLHSSSRYKC